MPDYLTLLASFFTLVINFLHYRLCVAVSFLSALIVKFYLKSVRSSVLLVDTFFDLAITFLIVLTCWVWILNAIRWSIGSNIPILNWRRYTVSLHYSCIFGNSHSSLLKIAWFKFLCLCEVHTECGKVHSGKSYAIYEGKALNQINWIGWDKVIAKLKFINISCPFIFYIVIAQWNFSFSAPFRL